MNKKYTLKGAPRASSLDLLRALNAEQRDAVESDAPRLLILAGAGSGKTRTLTYRVARLIEKGTAPEKIVLVTFTHRAAREMIARLDALLGTAATRVRAGTFHALAHRALRKHGRAIGVLPGFTILDRDDQNSVMSQTIAGADIPIAERRFPSTSLLIQLRSLMIDCELSLGSVIVKRAPQIALLEEQVSRVLELYEEKKREINAVDFDDLLLGWRALLTRSDELGEMLRSEIEQVLVDEFQDTNKLQAEIAELLAQASGALCVVGDDAQSIYAFRGADFENILDFPRKSKTDVHQLLTNYRSTPEILALANEVIKHNPLQFPKELKAVKPKTLLPALIPARDVIQQAQFIGQRVLELRDEGIPLAEQAILYRAHSHAMELEIELTRRGIPYFLRSGVRFFEQAHVKDALAYVRVVANPSDELAWHRILSTVPGVGTKTAAKMLALPPETRGIDENPLDGLPPRAKNGLTLAFSMLASLRTLRSSPAKMLRLLCAEGVLVDHVKAAYANSETRLAELAQLADIAEIEPDLDAFLGETALISAQSTEDAGAKNKDKERIVLSTVHQAKGLEWRVVFLAHLVDGSFPNQTALEERGGEAEERRLFYVAVTRAMEQLYLSYPVTRSLGPGGDRSMTRPSRFITELTNPVELLEKWMLE